MYKPLIRNAQRPDGTRYIQDISDYKREVLGAISEVIQNYEFTGTTNWEELSREGTFLWILRECLERRASLAINDHYGQDLVRQRIFQDVNAAMDGRLEQITTQHVRMPNLDDRKNFCITAYLRGPDLYIWYR